MPEVTAALVKELRDATGISMMKCKNALVEAEGDLEKAREILRKSGEKDAAKKSDRSTNEGAIGAAVNADGRKAALVKVLCETDFVARGEDFQGLLQALTSLTLDQGVEATKSQSDTLVQAAIQKCGENIQLSELVLEQVETGVIGSYIHGNQKIGVLVKLGKGSTELARDLAMQVAAMNPSYLLPTDVAESELAKEREIQSELLAQEGKPAEMAAKILEGKMKKFCEEQSLVKQNFVKDQSKTVEKVLSEAGAEIIGFVRLAI